MPPILLVGAGGLGCEILKMLVLANDEIDSKIDQIDIIDLDTIDVSNLNRQFLFDQNDIGQFKSIVSKQKLLSLNQRIKINAFVEPIQDASFDIDFYRKYLLVINALDNYEARSYVNKMCRFSGCNLIDGGSSGYLGQTRWFLHAFNCAIMDDDDKSNCYECFDCYPPPVAPNFATCTIRSNPSTIVHCVIWAKYLFENIFGDSSVDSSDVIASQGSRKESFLLNYSASSLFDKLFYHDLKSKEDNNEFKFMINKYLHDSQNTEIKTYFEIFEKYFKLLKSQRIEKGCLHFDKDNYCAMKFVYCVANVRALAFSISTSTEFEIESIAGNIIPTIVTTNSIVAGLMINEIMKYLHYRETDNYDKKLRNSFLNSNSSSGKYFVSNYIPVKNANCLICSGKRAISIQFDFSFSLSQNIITFLRTCEKFRSFEIVAENGSIIVEYGDESNFDELYLPPDLQKILLFAADYDSGKKIEIIAFNKPTSGNFTILN